MITRSALELWSDEQGVALPEYALVLAILAISMIVSMTLINNAAQDQYNATTSNLSNLSSLEQAPTSP